MWAGLAGEGRLRRLRAYLTYLARKKERVEMGDWAVADCEEVRTPWLALSGPGTVLS